MSQSWFVQDVNKSFSGLLANGSLGGLVKDATNAIDGIRHSRHRAAFVLLDVGVDASVAEDEAGWKHGRVGARLLADGAERSIFELQFAEIRAWRLRRRRHGLLLCDSTLVRVSIPPFEEVEEEDSHGEEVLGEVDNRANRVDEAPERSDQRRVVCVNGSSKIRALCLELDVVHGQARHAQTHQMQKRREIGRVVVEVEQLVDEVRSFVRGVEAGVQDAQHGGHLAP